MYLRSADIYYSVARRYSHRRFSLTQQEDQLNTVMAGLMSALDRKFASLFE